MKILTLNTWQERGPWRQRWKLIFSGLAQFRPDVAAFQEVFNRSWAKEIRKRSGFRFMVFPDQPGGLLLLSQHPLRDWGGFEYQTKSPTESYKRYALYAKIAYRGSEVAVFNTHLSWKIAEQKIRLRQVNELLQFINRKVRRRLPVFVTGDFNASPKAPEVRRMVRSKFADLFKIKRPHVSGFTWNNRNPFTAGASVKMPNRRIDYIWLRDSLKSFLLKKAEVVYAHPHQSLYASDHAGVLAELDDNLLNHGSPNV